jgi:hypothetical protein
MSVKLTVVLCVCGIEVILKTSYRVGPPQNIIRPDYRNIGSRDSSVGIATGNGLDSREIGVRVPVGSRIFSSLVQPIASRRTDCAFKDLPLRA